MVLYLRSIDYCTRGVRRETFALLDYLLGQSRLDEGEPAGLGSDGDSHICNGSIVSCGIEI